MKTVIEMAKEAGLLTIGTADGSEAVYTWPKGITEEIERFAELVRADERARMAEQPAQQEPVAWMYEWNGTTHFTVTDQRFIEKAHPHFNKSTPLYTAPQQAALPLSAEQIEQLCHDTDHQVADHPQTWRWTEAFARAIEAAHGIKGEA